jgi:hypothetical protein
MYQRGDSNSHTFDGTSTSSWRVYQFRHLGVCSANIYLFAEYTQTIVS